LKDFKEKVKTSGNRLFVGFLNGMAILTPALITYFIISFLARKVNDIVLNPFLRILSIEDPKPYHVIIIKSLILGLVIFCVYLIGWGARVIVVHRFFTWGENIVKKVPLLGKIYNTIKEIFSAFLGQGKTVFSQVVMIEYPKVGIYSIGFATATSIDEVKNRIGKACVNVFIPTTPNPTTGMLIVVPEEEVHYLKLRVEDAMKMVISGGFFTKSSAEKNEEAK
jgi:uncharacterized membrane protein